MNKRAGFFRRFPALFLDGIIIGVLILPFGKPVSHLLSALGVSLASIDTNAAAWGTLLFYFWTIAILYLLIEIFAGATPGKLILKLKVAGEDGLPAPWGRRWGRYAGKVFFLLIIPPFGMTEIDVIIYTFLALGIVSFLGAFLIFGPRKQTLYDRLTKTAVFKG